MGEGGGRKGGAVMGGRRHVWEKDAEDVDGHNTIEGGARGRAKRKGHGSGAEADKIKYT